MKDPIYLNTDLEITSKNDLTPIVDEFGEDVFVMYNGDWGKNQRAEFEVSSPIADVNGAIGFFCMLVESLSMNAKKLWDESYSKTFSVGFDSGNSKSNLELKIDPQIVNRVSEIGASISIVIYPLDENE